MALLIPNVRTRGRWIFGFIYGWLIHWRKGSSERDGRKFYQDALLDKFSPPDGNRTMIRRTFTPSLHTTITVLQRRSLSQCSKIGRKNNNMEAFALSSDVTALLLSLQLSLLRLSSYYGWKSLNVFNTWDCRVLVGEWWNGKDEKEVEWPNLDSVPEFA